MANPNPAAETAPRTTGPLPRRVIKEAFLDHVDESRFSRFVASSNRIDRYGDIIEQEWALDDFMKNPVFLWSHNSWGEPIGWVREFEANAERTETIARVEFAPAGHDPFVDKLVRAVNMRLIRAVSVGFMPVEMEDRLDERGRWDGYRFLRSQLIELSLCTIPANPEEYDQRIDAILGRTAPALPAPETASETDEEAVMRLSEPERPVSFVPKADWAAAAAAAVKKPDDEVVAGAAEFLGTRLNRAKLKGAVATKAKAKFNADVNAILSRDNGGLTIHQLADGVPLEEWWETGLSPEQAAVRCLDWRTKSTMLPPDEVEPGEEFERAASPE